MSDSQGLKLIHITYYLCAFMDFSVFLFSHLEYEKNNHFSL